jgi:hypothetical protein
MQVMGKLNWLSGWCLGDGNAVSSQAEKCQSPDDDRNSPHWADHPFKESSDHAISSVSVVREIMHEIILNHTVFVNIIREMWLIKSHPLPLFCSHTHLGIDFTKNQPGIAAI